MDDDLDRLERAFPGGRVNRLALPGGRRLIVREGRGARVVGHDGRTYVDYLLSSGPMILGHAHPEVVEAVQRQASRGTSFHLPTEEALALAERVIRLVPCAEQVRFCGSGSEATMFALRLARAATGRDAVLKLEGAFHGNHDAALMSLAPAGPPAYPAAEPSSAGIPGAAAGDVLVAPFNDLATATAIVEAHASRLAAVIVEPVQRVLAPAPGFLAGLRALCDRHGIALVFDEVVTGFRLAPGGAQERFGVVPDLCALGKVLGGGLPLGAVAGRAALMAEMAVPGAAGAYVSGTLSGNPLSCAAGLATLDVLARPGAYARLDATADALRSGLADALGTAGVAAEVLGVGSILQVAFLDAAPADYRALAAADAGRAGRFAGALLDRGILWTGGKAYLSLAHGPAELAETLAAAREAAAALAG